MSYTYSSVTCAEEQGSCWENGDIFQGFSAGVTLRCAYSDRLNLIADVLGTPRPYPKVSSGLVPYAISARARPGDGLQQMPNGQGADYLDALVDVQYNTTITDVAAESIEPNMEAIPLDYTRFNWGGTGSPKLLLEGEAPPLILQSFNLTRTRFRLSTVPTDVCNAVGCVNLYSYTSTILGLTFAPETLLFLPSPINRSFTNFTATGFTLTIKFSYKPNGWNKYWRTQTQAWENIYLNNSGSAYKSYPTYDMTTLLS